MWIVWFQGSLYEDQPQMEAIFTTQDEAESALDACKGYHNRQNWEWWVDYMEIGLPAYLKDKE